MEPLLFLALGNVLSGKVFFSNAMMVAFIKFLFIQSIFQVLSMYFLDAKISKRYNVLAL